MAITSKEPTPAGSHTNTALLPLSPSDSGNAAQRLPKCREFSSRDISTSSMRRCASPGFSRNHGTTPVQEASSAVQSLERRQRVATRLNTLDLRFAGKASSAAQSAPSHRGVLTCTRSLAVAFQGQSFSLQVSKAKPAPLTARRATPERRRQGPPAAGQQASYTSTYEDCSDQRGKFFGSAGNVPDSQRNPIPQSTGRSECSAFPDADSPMSSSSPKGILNGRRHPSPVYRTVIQSASPSKIVISSPVRGGASPSRVRSTVAGILSSAIASNAPSIWSSAADLRRGRIAESRIVDAHGLRLLYNRLLQWRFVNARAQSSLNAQEADALSNLYGTWIVISKLRKSVRAKRMELQLQRHNKKLSSILQGQMSSLETWESMDRGYSSSLSGATEALQASTLRLPVVGGARVDIQKVRDAVSSAADVMQGMASTMCFLLSKVEVLKSSVVELKGVATKECSLLNHSIHLLSGVAALQVKEYSLKAYEIQATQALSGGELRN